MTPVRLKPAAPRFQFKHSTTEPLRSHRQVVRIPLGTYCAPLVADFSLLCYERDFMISLSDDKQADIIHAFNTTSRYLNDILNII